MILLTFNISISEIKLSRKKNIPENELIKFIEEKTELVMLLLEHHELKATFFIDISLAEKLMKLVKNISFSGHEVALYHTNSDLLAIQATKQILEQVLQKPIRGLRQKYHQLSHRQIKELDFSYVSEINESKINFLWRKLTEKTVIHNDNELTIIPESQSPYSQVPFNDYVLQVTPMKYYENMLLESLNNNEYVMIYANIWQFFGNADSPFEIPFYKKINIGRQFGDRLERLFRFINEKEIAVSRMKDYLF